MKLELLISCMHQKDASIITRSNVDSDVVVINQCDIDKKENFNFFNRNGVSCKTRPYRPRDGGVPLFLQRGIRPPGYGVSRGVS